MSRSRKYPEELLERGVRFALESGRPIAHVARDLGIHSEMRRKRVRQAEADQGLRPDLPTSADHQVLASVGSVDDDYDNALAESFVDSFKTELIADRVWRTRSQLEFAVVEYIGWYNGACLHESLGDSPPLEYEQQHAQRGATTLVGATA